MLFESLGLIYYLQRISNAIIANAFLEFVAYNISKKAFIYSIYLLVIRKIQHPNYRLTRYICTHRSVFRHYTM